MATRLTSLQLIWALVALSGKCSARIHDKMGLDISGGSDSVVPQAKIIGSSPSGSSARQGNMFVFSMSYQPEFCYQHRKDGYPGCLNPNPIWKSSLTIHGLWPEFTDGSWPSTCTDEKFSQQTVDDIGLNRFELNWPNVKVRSGEDGYMGFWDHEWTKHGTCTGLRQDAYFKTALDNALATPDIVGDNYGESVKKVDLIQGFVDASSASQSSTGDAANMFVAVCDHSGKYLSEVRVCLDMDDNGFPAGVCECPTTVLNEGQCHDDINIPVFPSDALEER